MKIVIPKDAVGIAVDYNGDSNHLTVVRFLPEENKVIPQFQLNANPVSNQFGEWCQVGLVRSSTNAQHFISLKSRKAKRMWFVNTNRQFVDIWNKDQGFVLPENVVYSKD